MAPLYILEKYSNSISNSNLLQLNPTNMIIIKLIKYIVAMVGNMAKGTINDYKAKVEVLVEVHFEIITRRNAMFVRNRIAN